jgi:hypothetical protein
MQPSTLPRSLILGNEFNLEKSLDAGSTRPNRKKRGNFLWENKDRPYKQGVLDSLEIEKGALHIYIIALPAASAINHMCGAKSE